MHPGYEVFAEPGDVLICFIQNLVENMFLRVKYEVVKV